MNVVKRQQGPARYPRATIRLRYGRKMLRHGLALGWRTEWDGDPFPVTVVRRLTDSGSAGGRLVTERLAFLRDAA